MLSPIADYGCRNRIFINTFNKIINMAQEKLERPLGLKLILAYGVILLILTLVSITSFIGLIIGILFPFALYYGLWKMEKDWMYSFIILVSISILVSILSIYYIYSTLFVDITGIIFVALDSVSICWLYSNRNIFIEPERGKSARLV